MIKVYCDICHNLIDTWESNQQGFKSSVEGNYFTLEKPIGNLVDKLNFSFHESWKERHWCLECIYKAIKDHFDYQVYKSSKETAK